MFVTHQQTAELSQPRVGAIDNPSPPVATEISSAFESSFREAPFLPGRNCRVRKLCPSAAGWPRRPRPLFQEAPARRPATRLVPANVVADANRWKAKDMRRGEIATRHRTAESNKMPSKQTRFEASGRPRLSRRCFDFGLWQQRLNPFPMLVGQQLLPGLYGRSSNSSPASGVSACSEAEPICETRSMHFEEVVSYGPRDTGMDFVHRARRQLGFSTKQSSKKCSQY